MPLGYHVCFRPPDDRVIAPSDTTRRVLARVVHRIAGPSGLLAFRAADTHCHLETLRDELAAGELVRRVELSLTKRLGVASGLRLASVTEIERQQHLSNTLFYVLRQRSRHGLQSDPYHEASSLPDLLGARVAGRYLIGRVREYLPRVTRRQLLEVAGVDADQFGASVDPRYLPQAAAAAFAIPELAGRTREAVLARAAVVELATPLVSTREVAALLECSGRAVRRLRRLDAPRLSVRAVEIQARLRQAIDATSPSQADGTAPT